MENFLVLIFPDAKDKSALASLARAVLSELQTATGATPQMVHPNREAICLLVDGEFRAISDALRAACSNEVRYLVVRVDTPVEAFGLSAALAWLDSRTRKTPPK